MKSQESEQNIEDANVQMFDDVDYGKLYLRQFKERANNTLLEEDKMETEYDTPLDLQHAYKALKQVVRFSEV